MINKERMLQEFFELVQINSNSLNEREIGDLMKSRLSKLGAEVVEDEAGSTIGGNCGNVIATFRGTKTSAPMIMLTAHLDCVAPCHDVKPRIRNGVITSDGTTVLGGDDKAGVAAILEALRVMREQGFEHGGLQIVLTVCEEGGLNGSRNIDGELLKAELGYALDSSGRPGEIVVSAPGQNKISVKIHGKTAHAGIEPEKGLNAILAAARILCRVPQGRIDEETTCNVGIIAGGRATNIIPDLVEIECETRSRSKDKLDKLTEEIRQAFFKGAAECGVSIEVEVFRAYDAFVISPESGNVRLAKEAADRAGLVATLGETGGGSDANNFNKLGIECTILGIGMQKVHTCEEFILEEDLYKTAEWLLEIIKGAAR